MLAWPPFEIKFACDFDGRAKKTMNIVISKYYNLIVYSKISWVFSRSLKSLDWAISQRRSTSLAELSWARIATLWGVLGWGATSVRTAQIGLEIKPTLFNIRKIIFEFRISWCFRWYSNPDLEKWIFFVLIERRVNSEKYC